LKALGANFQQHQRLQAAFSNADRYALQWCFGFAPSHPLLAMMIDNICHYAPTL